VLSGVNRGQNLAEDVTLSGTVAGAIEGMALGIPSIALSQAMTYFHDEVVAHWETAEHFGPGHRPPPAGDRLAQGRDHERQLPGLAPEAVTEVEVTRQGFRDSHMRSMEKRTDLRGRDYYWTGFVGQAVHAGGGHRSEGRLRGPHLGHAVAHRPDAQSDRPCHEGRAGRRAAKIGGRSRDGPRPRPRRPRPGCRR
jgi:5'-nucleotidase